MRARSLYGKISGPSRVLAQVNHGKTLHCCCHLLAGRYHGFCSSVVRTFPNDHAPSFLDSLNTSVSGNLAVHNASRLCERRHAATSNLRLKIGMCKLVEPGHNSDRVCVQLNTWSCHGAALHCPEPSPGRAEMHKQTEWHEHPD